MKQRVVAALWFQTFLYGSGHTPTPYAAHLESPLDPGALFSSTPHLRLGSCLSHLGICAQPMGLPATIVISTKGSPRTNHLLIIHSNQTGSPHIPLLRHLPSSTLLATHGLEQWSSTKHTPSLLTPQSSSIRAFKERTLWPLIKIHSWPLFSFLTASLYHTVMLK